MAGKRKIDVRPSQFIERVLGKAAQRARGHNASTTTTRNAGQTSRSFQSPTGGAGLMNDPETGKMFWYVGAPIDDDDYVLK